MGRTYGLGNRLCLFLTGPGLPAVSDEVMFMRSSKVAISNVAAENAKFEGKNEKRMRVEVKIQGWERAQSSMWRTRTVIVTGTASHNQPCHTSFR